MPHAGMIPVSFTGFLIFLFVYISSNCQAQSGKPVLLLETEMHTARTSRISADSGAHYLLTCSEDRTARLWDRQTGKLLQIYRVPIGPFGIGQLYACALSPDGSQAVVGGRTGLESDGKFCVYIFNTQTAEIIHRLHDIENMISDIKFSPDGRWLAVAMEANAGVYIYELPAFQRRKLSDSTGDFVKLAFSPQQELAVLSNNGSLSVYDRGFALKRKTRLPQFSPNSLDFNLKDNELIVSYIDKGIVEMRDAATLVVKRSIRVDGPATPGNSLAFITLSGKDESLWAGGELSVIKNGEKKYILRKWLNGGKGSFKDYPLLFSSIADIISLPDGSVAVTGLQPEIAVIKSDGTEAWINSSVTNYYGSREAKDFTINETGDQIGCRPVARTPFLFNVKDRSIADGASELAGAVSRAGGTSIENWYNSIHPVINGRSVDFLKEYDVCLSADISNDGRYVALGTNSNLCVADKEGKAIWKVTLPGSASAVNISGNGKVVAAAISDGTIRWYRMTDGKELLALFIHEDKKRWIVFTPSGFYDAAPRADELIGWHLNNGPDKAATFYPIAKFSKTYYQPALIDALFTTYDEMQAIAFANSSSHKINSAGTDVRKKLPPTVTILSPSNGAAIGNTEVTITYRIDTSAGSNLKSLKVLVDGRPVPVSRGVKPVGGRKELLKITVPPKTCLVTLMAENEYGFGPEAKLYLQWDKGAKTDEFVIFPTLYALVIGVSDYTDPDLRLRYAAKDANDFAACITKQKGGLYKEVVIKSLTNKEASKENILDGFFWLRNQTTQHDVAMLFFAGHGTNDDDNNFFMLPVDGKQDKDKLLSSCVSSADLQRSITSIPGKVLVFIDACNSGNVMGNGRRGITDINTLANELSSSENGAIIFTASTGKGFSREDENWQNGAFTKALVEGLGGAARVNETIKITVKSLDLYITERVKILTGGKQSPTTTYPPNIPDFPIGVSQQ